MHVARMKRSPDSLKHHEREANPSPCSGTTYTCYLMIQTNAVTIVISMDKQQVCVGLEENTEGLFEVGKVL